MTALSRLSDLSCVVELDAARHVGAADDAKDLLVVAFLNADLVVQDLALEDMSVVWS